MYEDGLTSREAGELLGVNDSRIRQMLLAGELHGVKRGGIWFFKRSDVEALQRAREAKKHAKKAEVKST